MRQRSCQTDLRVARVPRGTRAMPVNEKPRVSRGDGFIVPLMYEIRCLAEHSQAEETVHLSKQNQYHHYRSDKFDTEIVEDFGLELSTI